VAPANRRDFISDTFPTGNVPVDISVLRKFIEGRFHQPACGTKQVDGMLTGY
jgi:hypothetical protein